LGGVVGGVVDKRVGAFLLGLFGVGPIGGLMGAGIAELVSKLLRRLLERLGIAKNETIECLRNIVDTAKEASQYIDDEGLRDVVEEVAKKWGWDVDTFRRFVKTAAGKSVTEDEVRRMIEEALKRIEEELENIKRNIEEELRKVESKIEGSKIGIGIFFLNDVENGLLYGNFIVEGGVPRIITWVGTAKDNLVTDLVDAGEFRKVAEEVFSKLVKDGRVMLIGPRGIGKSTLATYVAWRSLLGSLGNVALNEPVDAVIRVDSLNPGDAAKLNNLIKATSRRFVVIYDPSPIEAYYKPEAMQVVKHGIESIKKTTLKELIEVRNAWVIIILPRELYEQVQRGKEEDVDLRQVLDNLERDVVTVNLKDEGFLREVIKKYSGCDDVSDDLVKGVMGFDSYTLVAKYVGIWLRERRCEIKEVNEALRESAGEPKLFFAHYIWGTILGKSMDLAMKVSVPLILHAAFGPIPEGITYITKAVNEGGAWKLIDRDRLAKSKLEDLREADLEPIAKWLSTRHEDLIEETLEELAGLQGEEVRNNYRNHGFENFIKALDWGYEKALEEVRGLGRETKLEEVEVNLLVFVGERLKNALKPYTDCWKRAALIIGLSLTGRVSLPGPEDLPSNVVGSLGDALNRCGVDDYLLVGNEIPPLTMNLARNYIHVLTEAFVDKYDKVIEEVNMILKVAKDRIVKNAGNRGGIYVVEALYGLGLTSIIANATDAVKPSDANAALRIASFAIQRVVSADLIRPILDALEPLRDKAPHRYIELLAPASSMEGFNGDTVRYILSELNYILSNYGDVVKEHAPSLVHAIIAYADLLGKHLVHFNSEDVEIVVRKIADLLNELGRFKSSLGVIAWAYALAPALEYVYVRGLMEERLGIDVVDKAIEVLGGLGRLRDEVQELMNDKEFMDYVESKYIKADEETVKKVIEVILDEVSHLKHALAIYRLHNDELDEAEELFNEAAKEFREISAYENYLTNRNWALRVGAIKGSLVGDELVNGFRQLYEETFNVKRFKLTAPYLSIASGTLGEYLVSLALAGDHETISKLLKMHWRVLNAYGQVSVLTRLMLNALLRPRVGLSGELRGKLSVNPGELIDAFGSKMLSEFLPALMVALGITKPEDGYEECKSIEDPMKRRDCRGAVLAAADNSDAIWWLRWKLIYNFNEQISEKEKSGWLRELGFDANAMISEFEKLVGRLDGKSLVQLIAPETPMTQLALMLHALVNDDKELAKAHTLYGTVNVGEKLLTRLYLETYKECCDLGSEGFRRAIARLFFYHV